jgi:uncharacterized protein (DUF1015 family)
MAEVHGFRGWRYDMAQVGSLADVTAPPYDVINAEDQKALYDLHPCNVIRLILNKEEPGDEVSDDRYKRAADFARHWQSEGILMQEHEDTLYVYHQEFEWEGTTYVRKGFLGRLRLEEFGKGEVYPHEQTMSGPKADRLALIKATKMNLSPIFGLYPDSDQEVQTPLENAILSETALECKDDLGVTHRMWPVSDTGVINAVRDKLRQKPIFIADGHHRYETANNYKNWLESEGQLGGELADPNYVMMMFVGMGDPGLAILPTHRLISGLPELTMNDVQEALKDHFELSEIGEGTEGAKKAWEDMEADGGQDVFGFGTPADGKWLFARLTDSSPMAELAEGKSEDWKALGVSLLHRLVLDHLIGKKYPDSEQSCKYIHLMGEVNSAMSDKTCQLACLVAPAGIDQVESIASKLEKMPPKSTYFYPKLLSGMVFNPLG